MELWHALVVEGDFAADEDVEDDSETPDIDFGASILSCLQQFRSSKVQTAAEGPQVIARRKEIAEPKIDDLDVSSFADQDILDFEVPMHDAVPVTVIQGTGDLTSKFPGLLLLELAVRDDVVQHLASVDVFKQHIPVIGRADDIPHAADIRVVEEGNDGRFSRSPDFLGAIRSFGVSATAMFVDCLSRNNLHSNLEV